MAERFYHQNYLLRTARLLRVGGYGVSIRVGSRAPWGQIDSEVDRLNVRFGSLADIGQPIRDVRITPEADMLIVGINLLSASSGHLAPLAGSVLIPSHAALRFSHWSLARNVNL